MSAPPIDPALTLYLRDPHHGGGTLADAAMPFVYQQLHAIARSQLARASRSDELQPTVLVHEAYVKLFGDGGVEVHDREHFYALAARAMRQICVDHVRAQRAIKRGGARTAVTFDEGLAHAMNLGIDVLDLHEALTELAELDPREARVVELRFFGGLTTAEAAIALGISLPTAEREWRAARAWLARRLGAAEAPPDAP